MPERELAKNFGSSNSPQGEFFCASQKEVIIVAIERKAGECSSSENTDKLKERALQGLNTLYSVNACCNTTDGERIRLIQEGLDALAKLPDQDRDAILQQFKLDRKPEGK